jgi:hypothetical protein
MQRFGQSVLLLAQEISSYHDPSKSRERKGKLWMALQQIFLAA